jgi:ABC-type transporter Mla subunit MlaD
MTTDQLKNVLKDLHRQLESAGAVDGELKSLLQVLDRDIEQLLNKRDDAPATDADAGLTGRAQELSARFAAQHPQLETALRELAQTLERMGI